MLQAMSMKRTTFHLMTDEVPHAALILAKTGMFSPEQHDEQYAEQLTSVPAKEYRELYQSAQNRFDKIHSHLSIDLPFPALQAEKVPTLDKLRSMNQWLASLWAVCSECEEHQREIDEEINLILSLQKSLTYFSGLEMNLQQLQQKKTFLDLQVGLVPEENLSRLRQAAGLAGYIIEVFHREKHQVHILIAGLLENKENMQSVLHAAGYRTFPIPEAFDNTPEVLREELTKRHEALLKERKEHLHERFIRINENMDDLIACWRVLKLIEPLHLLGNATKSRGELAIIHGWIPEEQLDAVTDMLHQSLTYPVHVESHSPSTDEYGRVPTVIRYPRWMMPFVTLTRSYGTPRYGEIDPSWLFAISSILLFGIMFGDVGHGAVLLASAVVFRKIFRSFAYLIAINGLSSIIFGFVYGSIFGDEHVLTPLWQSPLHHPTTVLLIAIYIGAAFVGLAMLINIYNQLTMNNRLRALYSPGGVPGVIALAALMLSFYASLSGQQTLIAFALLLVPVAFMMMAHYLWQTTEAPFNEKLFIVVIELFETLTSLASNVLSFLRVGAFSLNHVALMLAVFAMAEMLPGAGYWIMIVLGNLFVIVFEGAIVMIQVLRLEYYEGLSRYFHGDGNLFKPLRLSESPALYQYT